MRKRSFSLSHPLWLITGILLIAASLRAPITGIAPLLGMIRADFALGTVEIGALTTLPLLAFAFASPFCVLLAREYGLERSLFLALIVIGGGVLFRSMGAVWMLFIGSAIIGIGIAIANVLLPALLKRDFPDHIASLTGAYALVAGLVAALTSALAVPIAKLPSSGWNWSLAAFIVLPVVAIIVWIPQLLNRSRPPAETATPPHSGPIWHSPLAWQVTLFFGLNSLIYYSVVTWLPAMLTESGYSAEAAGALHGVSQLATAVPGLVIAPLIQRFKDQRGIACATSLIVAISLLGLLVAPRWALIWAALFGFGTGATFILALSFVSLRAATVRQAGALSGMAQSVGYTMAAAAPPLLGLVHDMSSSWTVPLCLCVALCCAMAGFGAYAGRAAHIDNFNSII
ncbi:MFS transporter [Pseudochelatococcus contaminans]|uniref:CP family cyanate transporter-like MFS transporter n=1 Tax=Pseudochelatococcus contaminans TaxID=1538103 RepID=A0A7W5Z688_9HYPH|nr:MFS transporter [Pseudochelatococcus contaminans]MBB3810600.1 CP family cyanate transporter-like MFS transporter [Pseudochelatococcus contaminans]